MNKSQQLTDEGFTEATEADALFDDEATVLAQPVVPLAANAADAPEEMTVVAGMPVASGGPAAGIFTAARRPTLLALVLVSVLGGAVLGGTALYLFQRSRTAPAQTPAQTTAPAQPQAAGETTATTAPVENQQPAAQNSEQPATPATQDSEQPAPPAAETRPAAVQEQRPEAEQRREHEAGDDRADSRRREGRRGRGGDDDDEEERDALLEQATERRRRGDGAIDTQAPIPDDASPASRRAARVEEALRRIEDNRRARRARRVGVLH